MSHILIVGQKFSSHITYLEEHGHTYTLLQDVAKTKFPHHRFKHRVVADFSSQQTLLATVDRLKKHVDAVMATYEDYVLPTAWIAAHLGLPGLPISAAEACTDKFLMRSRFDAAPEKVSPSFATVSSEKDVRDFAQAHSFPLILKPANLAKSLLVTKSSSLEELLYHYQHSVELLQTVYKKHAPNRTPKLIIEEFLHGSIHSVDAFVDADGTPHVLEEIVDYQTGYDIGFDDNFHYSRILPSTLSAADTTALRHCAEIGVRALGMKSSPAHIEIIITPEGPRIVEIGARNGGYRERMHALANGIDITGAAIALAHGKLPAIIAKKNEPCAVLELFPQSSGIFTEIANENRARELPSVKHFKLKVAAGTAVGKAADGYKACAVVMLHNSNSEQFTKDLSFITERVRVQTD